MTFWELVRVLIRYWPVVAVGAVLTAGAGFVLVQGDGIYYTRAQIAFRAPTSETNPNAFRTQSEEVIITAGIVAKRLSGADDQPKFASPEVTLVGLDTRDGWSLRLPDTGGQWATNFTTQMLILDVVGPSRAEVSARRELIIQRVQQELLDMQRAAGTSPAFYITAGPTSDSTSVYLAQGNRPRALGMTAILGTSVTIAAVVLLDRRRRLTGPEVARAESAVVGR